jgi:hypothetical protein
MSTVEVGTIWNPPLSGNFGSSYLGRVVFTAGHWRETGFQAISLFGGTTPRKASLMNGLTLTFMG